MTKGTQQTADVNVDPRSEEGHRRAGWFARSLVEAVIKGTQPTPYPASGLLRTLTPDQAEQARREHRADFAARFAGVMGYPVPEAELDRWYGAA